MLRITFNVGSNAKAICYGFASPVTFLCSPHIAAVPISVTEDYTCPFFHLKYASYKVFESHLRASHDLFNCDFWGEGDYQVVNVSAKITASSSEAEKRDVVGLQEQALKEAFEIFCNMGVAGSSSAELPATFCDNILKKGGSEKLSDEAIEDTLEKKVKGMR
ncbi:hypothetical protein L1987_25452 [Smallanthus sonchifolius]|uniref:Uncharacterized protein n=1 Tax=Smallanthus sonchifolius TaxID=185202 RepID=A0ACB9IPS7_9ASTR|nr:hypothetical protein L1987_25452 [Smallanthus sonchifolius]